MQVHHDYRQCILLSHLFRTKIKNFPGNLPATRDESSYVLEVSEREIRCRAADASGLFYGAETLCQLIRANRIGNDLPCLTIRDWPSLRWRCFQDDMTRGPSSTLNTLQQHIDLGAELKMNLFTYYMEYQYAFQKHPLIGPKDGSLLPDELKTLVDYAKARHIDILGNQQSFGHFTRILKHQQYAPLRETAVLALSGQGRDIPTAGRHVFRGLPAACPFRCSTSAATRLAGLGTGRRSRWPRRSAWAAFTCGTSAASTICCRDKYQKRMMMWGDIILQHPDKLDQVPKDTVMLTWGYGPQDEFRGPDRAVHPIGLRVLRVSRDQQLEPDSARFRAWRPPTSRISSATAPSMGPSACSTRPGRTTAKRCRATSGTAMHGGPSAPGTPRHTSPEDFNRRMGAVLFGEPGDHFGRGDRAADRRRIACLAWAT